MHASHKRSRFGQLGRIALFAAMAGLPLLAAGDDTDIYIDNTRPVSDSSLPMVMFSIDYRANLGSTICSNADPASCPQSAYFETALGSDVWAAVRPPAGSPLTFFDLIRLSLRIVLRETKGYKAGLMLNHNNTSVSRIAPPAIVNTDPCTASGGAKFAIGDAYAVEGNSATRNEEAVFTVSLSAACGNRVAVDYELVFGGGAAPADATDIVGIRVGSGTVSSSLTGTIEFNNSGNRTNTSTLIFVPIRGDTTVEDHESFVMRLTNPRVVSGPGTVSLHPTNASGTGSIENDDGAVAGCSGPLASGVVCSNGGYIARRFKPVRSTVGRNAAENDESRGELLAIIDSLPPTGGNISQPYQGKELFYEFFRYLTGQRVYNGANGWNDYGTNSTGNLPRRDVNPDNAAGTYTGAFRDVTATTSDFTDASSSLTAAEKAQRLAVGRDWRAAASGSTGERVYRSPLREADSCAKIFTINFLFGVSNQENDSDAAINEGAASGSGNGGFGLPTPIDTTNAGFSQVIGFLQDADLAPDDSSSPVYGSADRTGFITSKQNVTSFFIARPSPENSDPPQFDLVTKSYAKEGGTNHPLPLASDPAKLVAAIRSALDQILSVSTTFVAASVPVNVFNRAEIVNNVYFAVFQAEAGARWPGNLKKLKLGSVENEDGDPETLIMDANNAPAIETTATDAQNVGRIKPSALSSWTVIGSGGTGPLRVGDINGDSVVDNFSPPGSTTAANPPGIVTYRDGRFISRGGAGQKIPGFMAGYSPGSTNPTDTEEAPDNGPRKVYWLKTGTSTALDALDSTLDATEQEQVKLQMGSTAALPISNTELNELLAFARGLDVDDTDGDGSATDARFWIMGDSLHSRPLPINYGGTEANPTIYIALASNDGHLRFIRNTTAGGVESGKEVWSFMPPEGLIVQRQLRRESTSAVPTHPYSLDGEPSALIIDTDADGQVEPAGGDRVLLFFGLGRGGKAYYALDVTRPERPQFLWRIGPGRRITPTSNAPTSDYDEMGLTLSRPRVGSVMSSIGGTVQRRFALFFGGGYYGGHVVDANGQNTETRIGNDVDGLMQDDPTGNAVFVVRASDGALIWKAVGSSSSATAGTRVHRNGGLRDSIPSNVTVVDTDNDGIQDRLYVGDTGGNVWRADFRPDVDGDGTTEDDWTLTRLACLGRHSGGSAAGGCTSDTSPDNTSLVNDRRFFHEPDVIQARSGESRFDAIVIGSGDRANPLDQGPLVSGSVSQIDVDNYFFMIKDTATGPGGTVRSDVNFHDLSDINNSSTCPTPTTCTVGDYGWKLPMLQGPNGDGEKVLSAPVTIANTVFFTTYVPPPLVVNTQQCGPQEGGGRLYAVSIFDAAPAKDYDDDGTSGEASDRSFNLGTPGIPAQVVFLGSPSAFAGEGGGGGGGAHTSCTLNVLAGGQVFEAPGCPRFRTFWQRVGS